MNLKVCFALLATLLLVASPSWARSKKKEAADAAAIQMRPPQVLEASDTIIGVRTAVGDIYDGGSGVGAHLERQVSEYMSVAAQYFYSSYSQGVATFGEFKYTSHVFVGYASFHADILKIKNLDTSLNLGVAHNRLNSEWKSTVNFPNPGSATASSTNLVLFLNGRYFFNSHWAASLSVGKNLSTVLLGADYLF